MTEAEKAALAVAEAEKAIADKMVAEAKAAEDALAASKAKTTEGDDLSKLPPEKLAEMVKDLRKESAASRTRAKEASEKLSAVKLSLGIAENESPEEKLKKLTEERELATFENAILVNAMEHGVPKDSLDYFSYLIRREARALRDGEELPTEKIAALAVEAKGKSSKSATTSVATSAGSQPATSGQATLTVEQFAAMGYTEKAKLAASNEAVYSELMRQALSKKLIR
jgi:hypothetical protein